MLARGNAGQHRLWVAVLLERFSLQLYWSSFTYACEHAEAIGLEVGSLITSDYGREVFHQADGHGHGHATSQTAKYFTPD